MRITIKCMALFILLGFSTGAAGQATAPTLPLKLPDNVSWLNTVLDTMKDGTRGYRRHAFIARGAKWRLETETFNHPTVVMVFDGTSLASNIDFNPSKIPERNSPQFWDSRAYVRALYNELNMSLYKGIEKIDKYNCWLFSDEEEGNKIQLWIDVVKKIPRRLFVIAPGTIVTRQIYDDLHQPENITPDLFDPKNLNVILFSK